MTWADLLTYRLSKRTFLMNAFGLRCFDDPFIHTMGRHNKPITCIIGYTYDPNTSQTSPFKDNKEILTGVSWCTW